MAVVSDNLDSVIADIIFDAKRQIGFAFGSFITGLIREEIEGTWDSHYPIDVREDDSGDKTTVHWGDDSRRNGIPYILNFGVPAGNIKVQMDDFSAKTNAAATVQGRLRSVSGHWKRGTYNPNGIPGVGIEPRFFDDGMLRRSEQQFAQYAEAKLNL